MPRAAVKVLICRLTDGQLIGVLLTIQFFLPSSHVLEVEKPTKKEGSRDLLILESPKRKNLKNAVLSGWNPLPHQTVGCQRIRRFSTSVTMRSRISAQAVSTKMPAITVFMSKVVSACRIR